jgi:UDP-galactopyranose mutase
VHRKGMMLNDRLFPFPISRQSLENLPERDQILGELASRPAEIDRTNFETACISIFGPTLYKYFVDNYTRAMWGIEPRELTAEWAPKRLEFREDGNDELFRGQWQGLPKNGYSYLLEKVIEGLPVRYKTTAYDVEAHDVVVSTAPIDAIFDHRWGCLPYRSIRFHYQYDDCWEQANYGTINLPQHPRFIRKCNFKVLHRQESPKNRIQYQESVPAGGSDMPMYPVNTAENDQLYERYLQEICRSPSLCPTGRLGLFKYLDMDKAVEVAFDMVDLVERYPAMSCGERFERIREIRDRY